MKKKRISSQHPWVTQYGQSPIPERDLCIHMALRKPEASYPSQIHTTPQEPVYKSAILEKPMDSMFSDMPDLTDTPEKVLFPNYLYAPWMWTMPDTSTLTQIL